MDQGSTLDSADSQAQAASVEPLPGAGLDRPYQPAEIETRWYEAWTARGSFTPPPPPEGGSSERAPFVILLPPPNVTGSLTLGHVLNHTLQDVVIRWKRMEGGVALWLPGMDHAGIATQNVVEALLKKEGKTRHDLGREAFVARVWSGRSSTAA
ncbi:MAG: class I tRNA ligase family protein [Candidatus Eisenbacteria bacterium]